MNYHELPFFEIKVIVFFFWQVGSGYSEGDPGYVERFSFAVDDLQKLAEEEQQRYPKCGAEC